MYALNKREADLCSWSLKQVMIMYSDNVIDDKMRKEMQTTINKLELFKSIDKDLDEKITFKEIMEFRDMHCKYYELDDCCEECEYYRNGGVSKLVDEYFEIYSK